MNLRLTIKLWMLGAVALCVATGSDAFTLGRARGGAFLGQPLDLTVSVQTAADEALSTNCFEAEVYYGENRQDASRVRVNVSETTPGQALSVKVTSLAAVDEPVVTVYLRGGCGQKSTRKYVLLADMVSEPEIVPAQVATPPRQASATIEAKVPVVATPVPSAAASQKAEPIEQPRKSRATGKQSGNAMRSSDRLAAYAPPNPPVIKKSRLKLAAIDLPERDPILRLSNELLSSPVEDLQKRAEAIATWRSLNETAQDVLNEQARMRAVDADLKTLREQTTKNQSLLLDLGGRLEKAEAQRYANPLVYGLLLVLLVLVGGLAWAWRRLREANVDPYPWWSGSTDGMDHAHMDLPLDTPVRETLVNPDSRVGQTQALSEKTQAFAAQPSAGRQAVDSVDIDIDVDLNLGPSVFAPVSGATPSTVPVQAGIAQQDRPRQDQPNVRDFAHSVAGTLRAINSHELLDARQQADFFMTLGQYEDAIHLLEGDIRDKGESNPLVYLDLLKILHTLSRKEEFDRYRNEFNALFTGEVPDYVDFNQSGNRLDQYPDVCRHITEAWHSSGALDVIEGYLVKSKDGAPDWHFDLEAYRDLLMLHGVAGRIEGLSDSVLAPFSASRATASSNTHQADGIRFDPSATFPVGADTEPLPSIGNAVHDDVDLNLDSGGQNLIDFEISGFSKTAGLNAPKK